MKYTTKKSFGKIDIIDEQGNIVCTVPWNGYARQVKPINTIFELFGITERVKV